VQAVKKNWRQALLADSDRQLLEWVEKLTLTPGQCRKEDILLLKKAGFSDGALHDAAQVVAYFNYINRIADGLGVDPEKEMLKK
jgi:uncharacterized peroxidase-related enzyme